MTPRARRIVAALAIAGGVRAALSWMLLRFRAEPDFSSYTKGGIGLYPSPIGRLLGIVGPGDFAMLSAIGAGICVYLVALLAVTYGRDGWHAALYFVVLPIGWLTAAASVDAPALALFLAGALYVRRREFRSARTFTAAAMLTHLQLVPFVLVGGVRWSRSAIATALPVAAVATVSLLLTPYAGVVERLVTIGFVGEATYALLVGGTLALLPTVVVGRAARAAYVAAAIAAVECGAQHHFQARYFLPAFAIACATARRSEAVDLVAA